MKIAANYFAVNSTVPPALSASATRTIPPPSSPQTHREEDQWKAEKNHTSNGNKVSLLCSQQPNAEYY
jgi:hypothetical protein